MPDFNYQAYDNAGAKETGVVTADSQQQAFLLLQEKGLHPTEIKAEKKSVHIFQSKISLADLEFLTSELSLLLASGIKIDRGLDIIRKTKSKPAMSKILNNITKNIKSGKSLAESFAEHPEHFDKLYCNLIELGEASGNLPEVFADLANDLKFKRELRAKVIGSLIYPSVIFSVCLLSIFFIFNFIIPRMSEMFAGVDGLPWYTQFMLDTSEWMINYQLYLVLGVVGAFAGVSQLLKSDAIKEKFHRVGLKLPVIENFIVTIERIRFNSGLSMMLRSGIQVDRALQLALGNITNKAIYQEVSIAQQKIKSGSALSPALQKTSLYPEFYISLLEVGEETGNLEKVFSEIANRSRAEFESWTQKLTTLLEPLMILFMGGIVGGVVVVMLLSMVSMNDIGF